MNKQFSQKTFKALWKQCFNKGFFNSSCKTSLNFGSLQGFLWKLLGFYQDSDMGFTSVFTNVYIINVWKHFETGFLQGHFLKLVFTQGIM